MTEPEALPVCRDEGITHHVFTTTPDSRKDRSETCAIDNQKKVAHNSPAIMREGLSE